MIRFLQRDNRLTKGFFVVIIAAASVGMVVYLIPGLTGMGSSSADTYAVIYPHWYNRLFSSGEKITQQQVSQRARQQIQRQNPQYADNPMIVHYIEQQVASQLVQREILLVEAEKLGIHASDDDVVQMLHRAPYGEVFFPNGQFIGDDRYTNIIATQTDMSVPDFEQEIKRDILVRRLQALITAGVTVSSEEARESYV